MNVVTDARILRPGVSWFADPHLVVVDMDQLWSEVLLVGPPEQPSSWSTWYHREAARLALPAARYLVLVAQIYEAVAPAIHGSGAHHA